LDISCCQKENKILANLNRSEKQATRIESLNVTGAVMQRGVEPADSAEVLVKKQFLARSAVNKKISATLRLCGKKNCLAQRRGDAENKKS